MTYPARSETLHTLRAAAIRRRDMLEALNTNRVSVNDQIDALAMTLRRIPDVPLTVGQSKLLAIIGREVLRRAGCRP